MHAAEITCTQAPTSLAVGAVVGRVCPLEVWVEALAPAAPTFSTALQQPRQGRYIGLII